jgi:iron complex transport system ATP-binding protein
LAFPFTALEVVLLGRTPHCVGGERDRDRHIAWQALSIADVVGLAERLYTTLSGGERQRVQLARVLAQIWDPPVDGSPRYLLLDEPVSSLDLAHQHAVLTLAHRLSRQGSGVLAVLHDLNLAAQYADRIAVLQAGRLQALGTPRDVLQAALIQRVFGVQARVAWDDELICPVVSVVPRIHAMRA